MSSTSSRMRVTSRRPLAPAGQVDLRDVAGDDHLRSEAEAREEHLHLLGRGVLRLVEHDERVVEGAAAHVRERRDLDRARREELRHHLGVHHLVERVVERPQVRVDLVGERAGQEPEPLARLDGRTGQDDAARPPCAAAPARPSPWRGRSCRCRPGRCRTRSCSRRSRRRTGLWPCGLRPDAPAAGGDDDLAEQLGRAWRWDRRRACGPSSSLRWVSRSWPARTSSRSSSMSRRTRGCDRRRRRGSRSRCRARAPRRRGTACSIVVSRRSCGPSSRTMAMPSMRSRSSSSRTGCGRSRVGALRVSRQAIPPRGRPRARGRARGRRSGRRRRRC